MKYIPLLALLAVIFTSCDPRPTAEYPLTETTLIPRPVSITPVEGAFTFPRKITISQNGPIDKLNTTVLQLNRTLNTLTGREVSLLSPGSTGTIDLDLSPDSTTNPEGYTIEIRKKNIFIKASTESGLYYGIQSLLQLLPETSKSQIVLPLGMITDNPKYEYRGAMLDVSRHFFGVEDVKKVIDYMAMYKLNYLHLHLSDDQGWRIEIKSWPNLTEYGSQTEVGEGKGGFYTQQQYQDIVNYAASKFITIVPEIDMPGHTNAALASYPELNCSGKAPDRYTGTDVGFSTLCINKEITYQFVDDVIRELAAITPGPYIHIGGDESQATAKKDYLSFIPKVNEIATKHGKQIIGWDEIAQTNISTDAIIQHWVHTDFSKAAAAKGNKILLSPSNKIYLDMKYDSLTRIGYTWAAIINTKTGYDWDPETLIPGVTGESILGIEAPLWTETVLNIDDIEYMLFPRLPGVAELAWSSGKNDWEEYKLRLIEQTPRWKVMDINYYPSEFLK